jgi:hypothetical protein
VPRKMITRGTEEPAAEPEKKYKTRAGRWTAVPQRPTPARTAAAVVREPDPSRRTRGRPSGDIGGPGDAHHVSLRSAGEKPYLDCDSDGPPDHLLPT